MHVSPHDVLYGEWSERWGREAARILLRTAPDTDAVFCGSDQLARDVSDALRLLGRRVPDDIALVGFDNWEPMALGADPPLTSVDMCLENVGRRAAEILLAAIDGARAHGVTTVPCQLVVRASSEAPGLPPAAPAAEPSALTATMTAPASAQQAVPDA